jgi:hypothetical protein
LSASLFPKKSLTKSIISRCCFGLWIAPAGLLPFGYHDPSMHSLVFTPQQPPTVHVWRHQGNATFSRGSYFGKLESLPSSSKPLDADKSKHVVQLTQGLGSVTYTIERHIITTEEGSTKTDHIIQGNISLVDLHPDLLLSH